MVTSYAMGSLSQEFDKIFGTRSTTTTYPPYNVIKIGDDEYVMEFAVAGFKKSDISISTDKNVLSITGEQEEREFADGDGYLHKGIAARKFTRAFTLPEYFEVLSAEMQDGILSVGLVRIIPEDKKPKTITIK
jgi:molecular chaperone IbpA